VKSVISVQYLMESKNNSFPVVSPSEFLWFKKSIFPFLCGETGANICFASGHFLLRIPYVPYLSAGANNFIDESVM